VAALLRPITHFRVSSFAELSLQFDNRAFYPVIANRDTLCHHYLTDTISFFLLSFRLPNPHTSLIILHRLMPRFNLVWELKNEIMHVTLHVPEKNTHHSFNLASSVKSIKVLG